MAAHKTPSRWWLAATAAFVVGVVGVVFLVKPWSGVTGA
jgi:hypothetical protein